MPLCFPPPLSAFLRFSSTRLRPHTAASHSPEGSAPSLPVNRMAPSEGTKTASPSTFQGPQVSVWMATQVCMCTPDSPLLMPPTPHPLHCLRHLHIAETASPPSYMRPPPHVPSVGAVALSCLRHHRCLRSHLLRCNHRHRLSRRSHAVSLSTGAFTPPSLSGRGPHTSTVSPNTSQRHTHHHRLGALPAPAATFIPTARRSDGI